MGMGAEPCFFSQNEFQIGIAKAAPSAVDAAGRHSHKVRLANVGWADRGAAIANAKRWLPTGSVCSGPPRVAPGA